MRFLILGPLHVEAADGREIEIGASLERSLLLRLLLDANRPVATGRLIEDLWGADAPRTALPTVRVYVSRLRKALGETGRIQTTPTGYKLVLEPQECDLLRFESLIEQAHQELPHERTAQRRTAQPGNAGPDPDLAGRLLTEAIALWRGTPLVDVADAAWARPDVARLEESRLTALEDRIALDLGAGRHVALIAELEALSAREPLRERIWAARMLALYRCDRAADALAAFSQLRRHLVAELGLEPSAKLRGLQARILREDPALHLPRRRPADAAALAVASDAQRMLASPRPARGNVARARTSFVTGAISVSELGTRLTQTRGLLTLTGPPGAGKTRLATEAALALAAGYPGGSWIVELAPLRDRSLLGARIVETFGVDQDAGRDPLQILHDNLSPEPALLVLDNCEHLTDACAELVEELLARLPQLTVIATSRERLGVAGEVVISVPPLQVPDREETDPAQIAGMPACRLFVERATAAGGYLDLDRPSAVAAVADICRRVDGLPLGLELAAARTAVLSVNDIAARLDGALGLLSSRPGRGSSRQRTLRALIDWSYSLLTEPERLLLRRLAVFAGGAPLSAVEDVCAVAPLCREECVDLLHGLVERSLVVVDTQRDETRYRLLETIRSFGEEQLETSGEAAALRQAHARWCTEFVERAHLLWAQGEQSAGLGLISREQDNWRAALRRLIGSADGVAATRLAAQLGQWWYVTGRIREGRITIDQVLALAAPRSRERAVALRFAGALARTNGDIDAARRHITAGIAIADSVEDFATMLQLQISLGATAWLGGDVAGSEATLTEALATAAVLGDHRAAGSINYNLAVIARNDGRLDQALDGLSCARAAWALAGDHRGLALISGMTATVMIRQGDRIGARREVGVALTELNGTGYVEAIVEQLETVAILDAYERQYARAARLIGQADHQRSAERLLRPPVDAREIEEAMSVVREHLGGDAEAALAAGRRLTLTAAVTLALGVCPRSAGSPTGVRAPRGAAGGN